MNSRSSAHRFILPALLAVGLLGGTAHAGTVVIPNGLTAAEGNVNNIAPFGVGMAGVTSFRYQQAYWSSEFPGQMKITGVRFRPDVTGGAFASTLPDVQINLSTTNRPVDGLSLTFSDNPGADDTVVFSGSLSLSSAYGGPLGGPKWFDIVINFSTPFAYEPALGNLLLDIRIYHGGTTTWTGFDAHSVHADSVSRVFAQGVSSPSGSQDSLGLVTQFVYSTNTPPLADAGPDQTGQQGVVATSATTTPVTLDGSASSDPDGDSLTYVWKENGTQIASGVSPTVNLSLGTHTITLVVDDGKGSTASDQVLVTVGYSRSTVLEPINTDGTSIFKLGSTVPVKFQLLGGSAAITNATATLGYAKIGEAGPGSINAESTAASTTGNLFRYDVTSGQYVFNWSTKNLPTGAGKYQLKIDLQDGNPIYAILSLKP
jgi:hypothetical protein